MCPRPWNIRGKEGVEQLMRCLSSFMHCVSVDIVHLVAREAAVMASKWTIFFNAIYPVNLLKPFFDLPLSMSAKVSFKKMYLGVSSSYAVSFTFQLLLYCRAVMRCVWGKGLWHIFLVLLIQILKLESSLYR